MSHNPGTAMDGKLLGVFFGSFVANV